MLLKRKIDGEFAAPGVITLKFALDAEDVGLMICTEIGQEIRVRQRRVVRQGNRVWAASRVAVLVDRDDERDDWLAEQGWTTYHTKDFAPSDLADKLADKVY